MDEFFLEPGHECEHAYSHESYQSKVQQEIERTYVIIKHAAPTRNCMLVFCLPRTEFLALQNVMDFLNQPHEHMEEIKYLREKIVIVKYPICPMLMWNFREAQQYHDYVQSVPGVLPQRGINPMPYPHTAMPWVRGMSLDEFIGFAKQQNKRIQPAFVWHVAASLLELAIGLRNGYPEQNGQRFPFAHNNLHPRNLLLDLTSSYTPFPNLVVIDFGRASVGQPFGPWARANDHRRAFAERLKQDLQQIGLVLHALAHGQHLSNCEDRIWDWSAYVVHGVCSCEEREVPDPTDFTRNDKDFAKILKQLLGGQVYLTSENSLNNLLEIARRRREEATQAAVGDPENRAFNHDKWDFGSSMVADQDIVLAVNQWVWDLSSAGFI